MPKKLSVPFLYPGVPMGLTPFRGLVPIGQRNLVPILPPAHPLGGEWDEIQSVWLLKQFLIQIFNVESKIFLISKYSNHACMI